MMNGGESCTASPQPWSQSQAARASCHRRHRGAQPSTPPMAIKLSPETPSRSACRFVGLLLVVKLMPEGDEQAVRAVLAALGMRFLHRLLLPLQRRPPHEPAPQVRPALLHSSAALCRAHAVVVACMSLRRKAGPQGLAAPCFGPAILPCLRFAGPRRGCAAHGCRTGSGHLGCWLPAARRGVRA
jgi:hypothetical protein